MIKAGDMVKLVKELNAGTEESFERHGLELGMTGSVLHTWKSDENIFNIEVEFDNGTVLCFAEEELEVIK